MSDELDYEDHAATIAALRKPFAASEVGHLPKMFCRDCSQSQQKTCQRHPRKSKCAECGGFHSDGTLHLDYVGHAEVTDRFLAVDPDWSWEPMSYGPNGLPQLDSNGGMWIRLTIGGLTKVGYGDAPGKTGGNAVKETIGDALRNAGMRFGVALDLWRKSERAEAEASKDDPNGDGVIPDGRVIGHGDMRVDRDDWTHQVAKADGMPSERAEAHLRALWNQAGEDTEMRAIVTAGINRWKARPAPAAEPAEQAVPAEPDVQPDGDSAGTDFLVDLDRAEKERDLLSIRQLIAKAQTMKRPDLRRQANDSLNGVKELLAAEAEG